MIRLALALLGALVLGGCAIPPPDPATPGPAGPAGIATTSNEALYRASLAAVWIGEGAYRLGTGVLVHDCPAHGVLVATCWHVVDEDLDYSVTTRYGYERYRAAVVAHDEEADVALLALEHLDAARVCYPVPRVNGGVPRDAHGTVAVWRDGATALQPEALSWYVPEWWWSSLEIRYGDSGAPLYHDGWVIGLLRQMVFKDRRRFRIASCAVLLALLREQVGVCE